jgi:hypothetical protein
MDVQVYLKTIDGLSYERLDLFQDEKIEINLNVKNLSDISKVRADFTQSFSIPTSPNNNTLLSYWFDADVDGTFNANIRIDAYIEVNSIPFKFGSVQLESSKLKNGLPYSYSITFYGNSVNLSDKFADDYLRDLDLSAYNHDYSISVIDSINDSSLSSGDIYYPLINCRTYMDYGSNADHDLKKNGNTITYKDFKPALRDLRIIEAIETKYGVTFSRDFLDRSIFYNSFLWLHKEAGQMKTSSTALAVDVQTLTTTTADWGVTTPEINLTTNSVVIDWINNFPTSTLPNNKISTIKIFINTTSTYSYKVEVFDNGILYDTHNNLAGDSEVLIYQKTFEQDNSNHNFTFKVSSIQGSISFTSIIFYGGNIVFSTDKRQLFADGTTQTTANSILKINEQIPEIKVKDYFTSLINQYNLIIVPKSSTEFYIDTLDNWYSKGKAYDISSLVDMKDVTINRPKVKKRIDFLYQKSDTILAKQYFDNNQLSYGDLKATYNITGDELKIETQFENMLFERLTDVSTSTQTDLQCGFAVDINNNPIKGKPIRFYRNGLESDHVHIDHVDHAGVWHTSTEDNIIFEQVTSSMNFGADNSSYFYSPIVTGLYYNFWKTYIEDLYNKKTRVLNLKCKLPIRILYNLGLNDRFVIGDYKYKISSIKTDLTNGDSTIEIYTDLSAPIDSVNNVNPLTIDSTEYTIDSDIITIDAISTYDPVTSYTLNGVSLTTYDATKGEENFEVKISANTNWSISSSDSWITPNKLTGNKSDYLRVKVSTNSGSARTGTLTITIGTSTTFTITINQA